MAEIKEVAVTCPCCESRITVDVRTRKIVTWRRAGELDPKGKPVLTEEDWDAAQGKVAARRETGEDRFDANLSREKAREKDLDDLFKQASERVREEPEKPDE